MLKYTLAVLVSILLVIMALQMLGALFAVIKWLAIVVAIAMLALVLFALYEVFFSGPGDDWGVW